MTYFEYSKILTYTNQWSFFLFVTKPDGQTFLKFGNLRKKSSPHKCDKSMKFTLEVAII